MASGCTARSSTLTPGSMSRDPRAPPVRRLGRRPRPPDATTRHAPWATPLDFAATSPRRWVVTLLPLVGIGTRDSGCFGFERAEGGNDVHQRSSESDSALAQLGRQCQVLIRETNTRGRWVPLDGRTRVRNRRSAHLPALPNMTGRGLLIHRFWVRVPGVRCPESSHPDCS
jgi:hypothetical protein